MSSDEVEKHFNAPRALDERFKEALRKSEFRTQSEFFRFHMMQFVHNFESKEKRRARHAQEKENDLNGGCCASEI